MKTFEIKDEFIVDGKPIKILSGAIHYFRIVPKHWEDSLYNLKALGFNTVETYIPVSYTHLIKEYDNTCYLYCYINLMFNEFWNNYEFYRNINKYYKAVYYRFYFSFYL